MATELRPGDLAIGIDFGGSGIKGAVVDVRTGQFVGDRIRVPTPSRRSLARSWRSWTGWSGACSTR